MPTIPDFTVGNTITVAVAIYKDNFKKFFKLSLIAHLWLLVPIYGWARYFAIAAWMSKLSLDVLRGKTNNFRQKQYFSIRALFGLLSISVLSIFISSSLSYLVVIVISALIVMLYAILTIFLPFPELNPSIFYPGDPLYPWTSSSIVILFITILPFFYTSFFITDLIFTEQQNFKIFSSIDRSRYLIKNVKYRILKIVWLSLVVSIPIWIIGYTIAELATWFLNEMNFTVSDLPSYTLAAFLSIVLISLPHIFVLPFWQSVKAVTFDVLTDIERYSLR